MNLSNTHSLVIHIQWWHVLLYVKQIVEKKKMEAREEWTEGTNASYMSEKHFNNQLTENLFSDEVFQTLNKHPSIKACSFIEGYIEWTAQST